jgi:ABC-type Fe3+/spermidine/putrescine transport system ATPase subunit
VLLDEPLSNLDAQLRLAMRAEFKDLRDRIGLTAIYVTHDQEEALVLSDRIAVMRGGVIEQLGTPADIHERPATAFVAGFVGVRNVLPCAVRRDGGRAAALLPGGILLAVRGPAPDGDACLCFRPHAVVLSAEARAGFIAAVVASTTYLGDAVQIDMRSGTIAITARVPPRDHPRPGATIYWSVPEHACFLVPA